MGCGKSKPADQVVEQPSAAPPAKSAPAAPGPGRSAAKGGAASKPAPGAAPAKNAGAPAASPAGEKPAAPKAAAGSGGGASLKPPAAAAGAHQPAPAPAAAAAAKPPAAAAPPAAAVPAPQPASTPTLAVVKEDTKAVHTDHSEPAAAAGSATPAPPSVPGAGGGAEAVPQAHPDSAAAAGHTAPAAGKAEQEAASLADVRVVFVLGGPGSGKGTQCSKIVEKYGYVHLSAGDLLREEVASGSALGRDLEAAMKDGALVPTGVTVGLLRGAMLRSGGTRFLIDGFPRAVDQAEVFEQEIKQPGLVIFFDCPEETMVERLLERGKTSGRSDDNEATIRKRFDTFHKASMPVVERYEAQQRCVRISAVPPPEEVFEQVCKAMDALSTGKSAAGAPPHAGNNEEAVVTQQQHHADGAAHAAEHAGAAEQAPERHAEALAA